MKRGHFYILFSGWTVELIAASIAVGLGVIALLPSALYEVSMSYYALRFVMPEFSLGMTALFVGVSGIVGLLCRNMVLRAITNLMIVLFWWFIVASLLTGSILLDGHVTPAHSTYLILAIFSSVAFIRMPYLLLLERGHD